MIFGFRKPRYVIEKVVDGVSSDWQWYTLFGALERRCLTPVEWSRRQLERILQVAGDPPDFGAPEPSEDVRVAGISLCQGYLEHVRAGRIACRPAIAAVEGNNVVFTDGSTRGQRDHLLRGGYDIDIPYLDEPSGRARIGSGALPPDLPPEPAGPRRDRAVPALGPYFPLLELQARWVAAVWSGGRRGLDGLGT